jgi:hypothetical protein
MCPLEKPKNIGPIVQTSVSQSEADVKFGASTVGGRRERKPEVSFWNDYWTLWQKAKIDHCRGSLREPNVLLAERIPSLMTSAISRFDRGAINDYPAAICEAIQERRKVRLSL